jgi:membrane-associated phospholipid phosphatase
MVCLRAVVIATLVVGGASTASADDTEWDSSVLYDGNAVPLLYAPIAANVALRMFGEVRESPRWFDDTDLGRERGENIVPHWAVVSGGVAVTGALLFDESRWFHAKGMAQTLALNGFATQLLKYTFGRRRPYYRPDGDNPEQARKSFPSGHASMSSAIAMYGGLFLGYRHFDDDTNTAVELGTYAALAGGVLAISYTRLHENAHHLSDVIIGLVLGGAIATAVFYYQDDRFESASTSTSGAPLMFMLSL